MNQNIEVAEIVRVLDSEIEKRELKNTKILIAETADWTYTYDGSGDKGRRNIMDNFFNPKYEETYIGNLKHVAKAIGAHSYWTDTDWKSLQSTREKVHRKAEELGLKVFQTEWSMLSSNYDSSEFPGFDKAKEIDIALYMSKVIHNDLTVANCESWSYWTSMDYADDNGRYHLVRLILDKSGDIFVSGGHKASKTLWVLGQFSRFVLPGYKRVDAVLNGSDKFFFGSAYVDLDETKLVVVIVNCNDDVKIVDLNVFGIKEKVLKNGKSYTTSDVDDLFERDIDRFNEISIQGKSICTFTFDIN